MYQKTLVMKPTKGRVYELVEDSILEEGTIDGLPTHKGEKWHEMLVYQDGKRVYRLLFPFDMTEEQCVEYMNEYIDKD